MEPIVKMRNKMRTGNDDHKRKVRDKKESYSRDGVKVDMTLDTDHTAGKVENSNSETAGTRFEMFRNGVEEKWRDLKLFLSLKSSLSRPPPIIYSAVE